MGLFTRKDMKDELPPPPTAPVDSLPPRISTVTPDEIRRMTDKSASFLAELLQHYRDISDQGLITLDDQKQLVAKLTSIAHEFEKVYELMRFDLEKMIEIDKYEQEAGKKRSELMKALEEPESDDSKNKPAKK